MWKQNGKYFGKLFLLVVLLFLSSYSMWSQVNESDQLRALKTWAINAQALIDEQANLINDQKKLIAEQQQTIGEQKSIINDQRILIEDQKNLTSDERSLSASLLSSLTETENERNAYRVGAFIGTGIIVVESILWVIREVAR